MSRAWAVDIDGLALGDAAERLAPDAVAAALSRSSPIYQRAVQTAGGQGARMAFASAPSSAPGRAAARVLVVVEHRFVPGRFDALGAHQIARWLSLASVLGRLASDAAAAEAAAPAASAASAASAHATPGSPDGSVPAAGIVAAGTGAGLGAGRARGVPDATTIHPMAGPRRQFPEILGESEQLKGALARLDLAIDSELPVLIVGETGVGKELFARAVHEHGARRGSPLVAVNCAAIPDSLFEAELFGHARGAFTGADRARPGLIARAEGGTLFLDEIGELALARQASLLRVLESRRYRPVGADDERPANVRVVAATNVDLEGAVDAGTFRQDLLFRLNVLRIRVPPLRERPADVALLAERFLARAGAAGKLSRAALEALQRHGWPGNVRELEHQMQRLAALPLERIELAHLPREIRASAAAGVTPLRSPDDEREEVARALEAVGGNISHAARVLGLTRHGLKKRMLRLGMRERSEAKNTP
jgi:serine/threonine-protein kinase PknK